jgi:hypothetical protein
MGKKRHTRRYMALNSTWNAIKFQLLLVKITGMIIGMPIRVLIGLIIGNHKDKIARNDRSIIKLNSKKLF